MFKKLFVNLQKNVPVNHDYEFDAILEDHIVGNQNIYRLHYVNFHRIGESYADMGYIGLMDASYEPFMLPEGMSRIDAFKVLSYLSEYIERTGNIRHRSSSSVKYLDKVLDLERFGFRRVCMNSCGVVDLFTVDGRLLLFKNSEFYKKYFDWFFEGVSLEELKNIYKKIGMELSDVVWLEEDIKRFSYKK